MFPITSRLACACRTPGQQVDLQNRKECGRPPSQDAVDPMGTYGGTCPKAFAVGDESAVTHIGTPESPASPAAD